MFNKCHQTTGIKPPFRPFSIYPWMAWQTSLVIQRWDNDPVITRRIPHLSFTSMLFWVGSRVVNCGFQQLCSSLSAANLSAPHKPRLLSKVILHAPTCINETRLWTIPPNHVVEHETCVVIHVTMPTAWLWETLCSGSGGQASAFLTNGFGARSYCAKKSFHPECCFSFHE